MVKEIATYLRGWLGYFGDCQTPSVLQSLESWLRRRLRSVVWKQWKRGRTRFRELCKRGIRQDLAAQTAGSPQGPWRLAQSPALTIALSNAYFAQLGASTHGRALLASSAEPPYADPHVRWCGRGAWATTSPMPI
jgi:RNA-directed DNA polymerase